MTAYTGRFRVEGNRLITSVDAAWVPAREGTEQPRFFETGRRQAHAVLETEPQRLPAGRAQSGPCGMGTRGVAEPMRGLRPRLPAT
jgi:hypothetical protein